MLLEKGINLPGFFKKALFLGNHPKVIEAVYSKKIDAGATYDAAFYGAAANQGLDLNELSIIATTDPIPQDAICAGPDLDEEMVNKIRQALFKINKENGPEFSVKGYGEISFMGGYKALFMENSHYGLSFGFNFTLDFLSNKKLKVGYAYRDLEILSSRHAYALGFVF